MGSGETSPTMVKTHRRLFARLGPPPVPAVLLDTPFGFQENASEVAGRAVEYFRQSVGQEVEVASYRSAGADVLGYETMLARLREARDAFSGPGSPTYALRQWSSSSVPSLLGEKLRTGGCVVFASAAAVTLGSAALPVYEVYKVGEDPRWLPGLDLLGEAGLQAAVIPHYNNAEGGTHDTRYCYLGERRLRAIEAELPGDAFVLGVDEHTGCVLDLDADRRRSWGSEPSRSGLGAAAPSSRRGRRFPSAASGSWPTSWLVALGPRGTRATPARGSGQARRLPPRPPPSVGPGPVTGGRPRLCSTPWGASRRRSRGRWKGETSPGRFGPCWSWTRSWRAGRGTPSSPMSAIGLAPRCGPWSCASESWPRPGAPTPTPWSRPWSRL